MLLDGLLEAVRLLLTGDEDTWSITALTLRVSLTATAVALLLGVPLGTALALGRFRRPPGAARGGQHRDGPAAGGGRAVRHRAAVA